MNRQQTNKTKKTAGKTKVDETKEREETKAESMEVEQESDELVERVLVQSDANLACTLHALTTEKEEIMGLLIGYRTHASTVVVSTLQLTRKDKRPDRVEIAEEQLATASDVADRLTKELHLKQQNGGASPPKRRRAMTTPSTTLHVVGWYHSHPHITAYPSHVDVATQRRFEAMDPAFVGLIYSCYDQAVATHASTSGTDGTSNASATRKKEPKNDGQATAAGGRGRHRILAFQSNNDYDAQVAARYSDLTSTESDEPILNYRLITVSVMPSALLRSGGLDAMLRGGVPTAASSGTKNQLPWWALGAPLGGQNERNGVPDTNTVNSVIGTVTNLVQEARQACDAVGDGNNDGRMRSLMGRYNDIILAKEMCRIERYVSAPTMKYLEDCAAAASIQKKPSRKQNKAVG